MRCIICGKSTWKRLYESHDRLYNVKGAFYTVQCRACGLIRTEPQLKGAELNKYYPSTRYYSYITSSKPGIFGRLRSYLISHLNKPTLVSRLVEIVIRVPAMPSVASGKILDIGCGSGDTLALLQSVGWECYGLDIDRDAIHIAHERGITNASFGSYEAMEKYPDNFFDVIRLYHVIEHLPDPPDCLRIARRKLKTGGEIIIGTPNIGSLIASIAKQYWYNLDCPRHLYLFTPKTLGRLIRDAGYTRQYVTFCSAGGWIGSIQYKLEQGLSKDIDLINRPLLVMLFYPLEWLLDKMGLGDVFVIRGQK
jgi:2-polyprenyl-3-methyl-5-hydroxy-6-metoxy-1,4-benzoquinol methylase